MKLLVLEHNTAQQDRMRAMLEEQGHELSFHIPSGLRATEGVSQYDAIVLLLSPSPKLPCLAELFRRLRNFESCAQSPILAIGAHALATKDLQALLAAGIQDYLGPPLESIRIEQRLQILERQARKTAELHRKIQYLGQKQQRRQRTEKALRTSMEDALKRSWDYLEILNDSLEDAIITLTMPERVIEYGNRAVERILGYTIDECQGESFDLFFPNHRGEREFSQQLHGAIRAQRASLHTEHILQRASGERFTAEITTTFMYEQDKLTRTVSSIRDITERKEMEDALRQERASLALKVEERTGELQMANKELAQASQHKDRFLANMSHELRTPLNAILGYAKILRKSDDLTQIQKDGLQTIQKSGEHLLHLITDILDLSKIEAGRLDLQLTELYLPDFLSHIADMIRVRAEEKSIHFSHEYDSGLPQGILADEKRLREILINLLDNAVKFTSQGEVLLRVCPREKSERYAWVLFEVEDSGPGISPEYLEDIFQPFQQGEQSSYSVEGTGLGLSICRQLVRLMGGDLKLRSTPGVGTTFSFVLEFPILEEIEAVPEPQLLEITGYKEPMRRILLVDDKPENRQILFHTLAPLGFILSEAESGLDCLAQLAEDAVDLVLLDLRMAELDGFETARRIRNLPGGEQVKIVATSAGVFEETREKSLATGCDDFLPKPIDEGELLDTLERLLRLEWISSDRPEETTNTPCADTIFPSLATADIEELRTFARHGNITKILRSLERLETHGDEYQPLIRLLRRHVASFQMKNILEVIESLETHA